MASCGAFGFSRPLRASARPAGAARSVAAIVSFIYFFPGAVDHHDRLQVASTTRWRCRRNFLFTPTLENFVRRVQPAFSAGADAQATNFDLYFFNSIFIAGTSVFLALVIGTLAAFGFSRYPLKGNDTYLFIILTTRMLPAIVVIIPIILMFRVAGLAGSYTGIIALYTAFNLPFTIWMMKSFFDELSPDVEDAARLDGSSDTRVFFKICLPQVDRRPRRDRGVRPDPHLERISLRAAPDRRRNAHRAGRHGADHRRRHRRALGPCWRRSRPCSSFPVILVTFFLQNHLLRGVTFGTIKR